MVLVLTFSILLFAERKATISAVLIVAFRSAKGT
jgi:hypothetical protein